MLVTALEERAGRLYDFAVEHPEGFQYPDIEHAFGWRRTEFFRAVRKLRLILAEDEINLPCEPQGSREHWLYRLVGNAGDSTSRIWHANRIGDCEARLETIESVAKSVALGSDARTTVGRKARKIASTIGYLRTELGDIDGIEIE